MRIARIATRVPVALLHTLVAQPINQLHSWAHSPKLPASVIKIEADMGSRKGQGPNGQPKRGIENAITDHLIDDSVTLDIMKRLEHHGRIEVVVILVDSDSHADVNLDISYIEERISKELKSPFVPIDITVHGQGHVNSTKKRSVVMTVNKAA